MDSKKSTPTAEMRVNRRCVRIEWGDCDPAGIVYFPRYFEIFDACTNAAFEAVGFPKRRLLKHFGIAGIPAVNIHASFMAPCSFGEDVAIDTRIVEWGRSSFKVNHRLLKGATTAVEGQEVRVWTATDPEDSKRLRSMPIPEELIALFNAPQH